MYFYIQIIQYFEKGQHCDENGKLRSTELHIQCCVGLPGYSELLSKGVFATDAKGTPGHVLKNDEMPVAILMKVEEGMLCNYKATACSSLLCTHNDDDDNNSNNDGSSGKDMKSKAGGRFSLINVMNAINNTCLHKLEEWWTYELCFGSGIRQVHYELQQSRIGNQFVQKQEAVNQYSLGHAPMVVFKSEELLQKHIM